MNTYKFGRSIYRHATKVKPILGLPPYLFKTTLRLQQPLSYCFYCEFSVKDSNYCISNNGEIRSYWFQEWLSQKEAVVTFHK